MPSASKLLRLTSLRFDRFRILPPHVNNFCPLPSIDWDRRQSMGKFRAIKDDDERPPKH